MMIEAAQVWAGCALVGWSQAELADAAGLPLAIVEHVRRRQPGPGRGRRQGARDARLRWSDVRAHGLRRAAATFAAENGATIPQLMAIFGWETTKMAAHYVKDVSQPKLAGDATHLIVANR